MLCRNFPLYVFVILASIFIFATKLLIILSTIYFETFQLQTSFTNLFLFGCLHKLGGNDPLYITLNNLAEEYGDIFSLYIGNRLTVVLSSKAAMYEALIKKAKWPDIPSMNVGSDDSSGIARTNINEQYRRNKLMVVTGDTDTERNYKTAQFI